jgi:hypothetical protein
LNVPLVVLEIAKIILRHPELADLGGNTGTVNSFVGVDISDLTGGVFDAEKLLEGNNLACFLFIEAQQAVPSALKGLLANVLEPLLEKLNTAIHPIINDLGCPVFTFNPGSINSSQFPGSTYRPTQ